MPNLIITAGPNPPQPTGTSGIFNVELSAAVEGYPTWFAFNALVDMTGGNPVPTMRAAIKAAAIAEAGNLGITVTGQDKVISLVDPVVN